MQDLYKSLQEIKRHFEPTVRDALELLKLRYSSEPLIGANTDETLVKVYQHDGKVKALDDVLDLFINGR